MKKYIIGISLYFTTVLVVLFFVREINIWNEFILDNIWPHMVVLLWLFQIIIYLIITLLSRPSSNKEGVILISLLLSIPGTIISLIILFYIVFWESLVGV